MKKTIFNVVLAVCTIGLVYACWWSITSDINFDKMKKEREQKVIARLMEIRNAEEKFRQTYGNYCGDIDSIIDFVKNGRAIDKIVKEGELSDDQLEAGMTEKEAVRQGLIKRDTIWIYTKDALGISNPDSLKYVPVGKEGGLIQLRKKETFNLKSNEWENLVEFRACLDDYMDGSDAKRIKNLKADLKKRGKNKADLFEDNADDELGTWYGLRVGDLNDPNNKMAGNWE